MFDVSWLSRYPDENERVFVGGSVPITVKSVTIVDTNKNYKTAFYALYIFDSMVSDGAIRKDIRIPPKVVDKIFRFINFKQLSSSCDPYIVTMFEAYKRRKKQIVINLAALSRLNKQMYGIIMEDELMRENTYSDDDNSEICNVTDIESTANLISSNVFQMFPKVHDIIIKTGAMAEDFCAVVNDHSYPFDLLYFLRIISPAKWTTITIQQMMVDEKNQEIEDTSWIRQLWSKSSIQLIQEFAKKEISIKFEAKPGKDGRGGCWIDSFLKIERLNN